MDDKKHLKHSEMEHMVRLRKDFEVGGRRCAVIKVGARGHMSGNGA